MVDWTQERYTEKLKNAFSLFDKEGNGTIRVKELGNVIRSLGHEPAGPKLKDIIHKMDLDEKGTMALPNFLVLMEQQLEETQEEEKLRKVFCLFDRGRRGFISAADLRQVLLNLGEKITDQEADELIKEADTNGDGKVTYEEFSKMMTSK